MMKWFMWLFEQGWLLPALVIIYCLVVAIIIAVEL